MLSPDDHIFLPPNGGNLLTAQLMTAHSSAVESSGINTTSLDGRGRVDLQTDLDQPSRTLRRKVHRVQDLWHRAQQDRYTFAG